MQSYMQEPFIEFLFSVNAAFATAVAASTSLVLGGVVGQPLKKLKRQCENDALTTVEKQKTIKKRGFDDVEQVSESFTPSFDYFRSKTRCNSIPVSPQHADWHANPNIAEDKMESSRSKVNHQDVICVSSINSEVQEPQFPLASLPIRQKAKSKNALTTLMVAHSTSNYGTIVKSNSTKSEIQASSKKALIPLNCEPNQTANSINNFLEKEVTIVSKLSMKEKKRLDKTTLLKVVNGTGSVTELDSLVQCIGRCVMNLGSKLTLLHLAAQFGRNDWVSFLVETKSHPIEVKTVHGETPLDQAAWKGHVSTVSLLLK